MEKLPVTYNSKEIPIWVKYWFSKKLSRKVSEILTGQSSYILENTLYKRFKKFEVGGNTEQYTTKGENILPFTERNLSNHGITYVCDERGNVNINGKATQYGSLTYNYEKPIKLNTGNYKLKIIGTFNKAYCSVYLNNEPSNPLALDVNKEAVINIDTDDTEILIKFLPEPNIQLDFNFYITLASGNTATTEYYTGEIASPNTEFKQPIQNVAGTIVNKVKNEDETEEQTAEFTLLEGQRLMLDSKLEDDGIHHKRKHYIITGKEGWSSYRFSSSSLYFSANMTLQNIKSYGTIKCNALINNTDKIYNLTGEAIGSLSDNILYICLKKSTIGATTENTASECTTLLKQYLETQLQNNTPFEIEYRLINDEIILYTPTQQEQYNANKNLKTYKGKTIVEATSDELSPILTLQYWQKNEETSSNLTLMKEYKNNEEIPNKIEIVDNENGTEIEETETKNVENEPEIKEKTFIDFVEEIGDIEESEVKDNETDS